MAPGASAYLYRFSCHRDMHVYFKGGSYHLGSIAHFPGESVEEKIVNAFRSEGTKCFTRLRHHFVLYLFDKATGGVYLVRDRFGIEPLFFKFLKDHCRFSQFMGELVEEEELDELSLGKYLIYYREGHLAADMRTFFKGIYAVPPGCYVKVDVHGAIDCVTYWGPTPEVLSDKQEEWLFEEFRTRLFHAVDLSTQGYTKVGAHLSGGLDSSIVALVYCKSKQTRIPTYFFGLNGDLKRDRYYAELVAKEVSASHEEILPEKDIYGCLFEMCQRGFAPEAFILPSNIHFAVSKAAKSAGCQALLTGNDGDSIVGHGYGYLQNLRHSDMQSFIAYCMQLQRSGSGLATDHRNIVGREFFNAVREYDIRRATAVMQASYKCIGLMPLEMTRFILDRWHSRWRYAAATGSMQDFLHPDFLNELPSPMVSQSDVAEYFDKEMVENFSAAVNAQSSAHFQQFFTLQQMLGVTYLHPFYDEDLFQLCLAVPNVVRFGNGRTRWLLRQATKDLMPEALYWRVDKDTFSEYLMASCRALWNSNRERFEENRTMWTYIDRTAFQKGMQLFLKGNVPFSLRLALARKLNRILYLGIWLDAMDNR